MASAFPLLGLFSFFLGGFEILVMSMQIGMIAGMVGVMIGGGAAQAAVAGGMTGLAIQLLLHLADRSLHGEVSGRVGRCPSGNGNKSGNHRRTSCPPQLLFAYADSQSKCNTPACRLL